jgi:hypothetical protein
LKTNCLKALNLLQVLSSTNWGSKSPHYLVITTLLKLYKSLIRSKLDYASVVYGSARKSYLQMLDTIHHQGLRLAYGAFRTSPVESLYAEDLEPSLHLRRKSYHFNMQLEFHLIAKSNPARNIIFKPSYTETFVNKLKEIKSLGLRLKDDLDKLKINPDSFLQNDDKDIPHWTYNSPKININLVSSN